MVQKSIKYIVFPLIILNTFNLLSQPCASCNTRKKFNFKLIKKEGIKIDTAILKLNGVYITSKQNKLFNPQIKDSIKKNVYFFYRFFENGRVFISCLYCAKPDSIELNNLEYGSYGYYRIDSNIIKIETFDPYPRYYFKYFLVRENSIIYKSTSKRKWKGQIKLEATPNLIFNFYKCKLYSTSFW